MTQTAYILLFEVIIFAVAINVAILSIVNKIYNVFVGNDEERENDK